MLVPGALLSFFAPGVGILTVVNDDGKSNGDAVIGQAIHAQGTPSAHLTYITPAEALGTQPFSKLLEYLMALSGERGARQLMADVDESSEAFESLRRENFAIYARQRIWKFENGAGSNGKDSWRAAESLDKIAIRSLYSDVIPGIIQQIEPVPDTNNEFVCYENDQILAFVDLKYGHRGIWVQPFVHPSVEDVGQLFANLIKAIPNRYGRPIYVCIRSYQSWLESALEALGAEASPQQAVMVKHLAVTQKALQGYALPKLEGRAPEITAQITEVKLMKK